jgi:uncharacterized protein YggT (Ycf19 family)
LDTFAFVFKKTVTLFLDAACIAMLARAVLSWFLREEDGGIMYFLVAVTEPLIYPVRALCSRFGWFENMPVDLPFMISFVLLSTLELYLEAYMAL